LIEETRVGRWEGFVRHEAKSSETIANIDRNEVLALANPVTEVVVRRCAILQSTTLQGRLMCQPVFTRYVCQSQLTWI
jgi:hypothetical protein